MGLDADAPPHRVLPAPALCSLLLAPMSGPPAQAGLALHPLQLSVPPIQQRRAPISISPASPLQDERGSPETRERYKVVQGTTYNIVEIGTLSRAGAGEKTANTRE
ncbi:hypothetical protein THAOC_10545 [Thalassiosira oceanica]|uniref:Uncharacterized protein n=1 Tax=Thalassiosira oceanica TaxID=159749 RepID=K0SPR9_THAOC|nr:hypothetical protein THAOC_10545 [Thalassiosira oceanica]|eukprot:EJK68288.1 hypothetical protein THAOC_10545 [Thalassiosira oceanica]